MAVFDLSSYAGTTVDAATGEESGSYLTVSGKDALFSGAAVPKTPEH